MARVSGTAGAGLRAVHAERSGCAARHAQARRRAAGRGQQPHLRRHQVSHPIDLVARRALCRADRRRAPTPTASRWCWSRPSSAKAWSPRRCRNTHLQHPHLPAGRADRRGSRAGLRYAVERIGFDYDLKNIIDLMRYLFPLPVPQRWRRRMIALGSGDPTRMICSALIAQAFERSRYPILPKVTPARKPAARREILEIRHRRCTRRATSTFRPISSGQADDRARLRLSPHRTGPICRTPDEPGDAEAAGDRCPWPRSAAATADRGA